MKKNALSFISPLLLAGILVILLPIFTIMTLDRLERQKDLFVQQLMEKGTALIRTFEAGTRTGMFTMRWGAQRIQTMLMETALQPEVVYMMITTREGLVLAHSDAEQMGRIFDAMPQGGDLSADPSRIAHRIRPAGEQEEIFEVYKRFVPVRSRFMPGNKHQRGMSPESQEHPAEPPECDPDNRDWSRPYLQCMQQDQDSGADPGEHYIFAGLSMEKERLAGDRLVRETVWRAIVFFFLGCAGLVSLFAFQAYKEARSSLSRIKAFSDQVIQNMPSGLVTLDIGRHITSMNQAARDILGRDLSEPLPEMCELIQDMGADASPVNREIGLETSPGRRLLLDVTVSPVRSVDHEITGYVFLFRDLTQIRDLKKQVETNRRMAAIGKLAAGVAHEIRNPLSSIKGFATYFGKRYETDADDRETAAIMVREVERINRSITQLLEFAKPLEVDIREVDVRELIDHSLKLVRHDLDQKRIQTRVNIDLDPPLMHTDGDRMNQVLLNLYINAVAALDPGGLLEIEVRKIPHEDRLEIRVRDNGAGIDEAFLDLIFDPYFTTRPTGTGLGLSIVHRIIESLGGGIRVDSRKGEGACFIIDLPIHERTDG